MRTLGVRLTALLVVALALGTTTIHHAQADDGVTVGIDVDVADNDATRLGERQSCRTVQGGDTFQVDAFITDVDDLLGFQFTLIYNPDVVGVIGLDDQFILDANPGSGQGGGGLYVGTDLARSDSPDADGQFRVAKLDLGLLEGIHESGSGVLARITLRAVAEGFTPLDLRYPGFPSAGGLQIKIFLSSGDELRVDNEGVVSVQQAHIWVGGDCNLATPTPNQDASPASTMPDADGTSVLGEAGGQAASSGSGPDATEGGGTAAGRETTEDGETAAGPEGDGTQGGALSGADDGGGLSTGTWLGIGVASAVVVVGSVGGAYVWRRRQRL